MAVVRLLVVTPAESPDVEEVTAVDTALLEEESRAPGGITPAMPPREGEVGLPTLEVLSASRMAALSYTSPPP